MSATSNIWGHLVSAVYFFLLALFPNIAFFYSNAGHFIWKNSDSGCYIPPESIQPTLEGKKEEKQLNLIQEWTQSW